MLSAYRYRPGFFSRNESASCQMVGLSEQAPGSLVDGRYSGLIEQVFLDPGDRQMVNEVLVHILTADALEMASGHDTGCQGLRGSIHELVDQVGLFCEDNGQIRLAVPVELGRVWSSANTSSLIKEASSMMSTIFIFFPSTSSRISPLIFLVMTALELPSWIRATSHQIRRGGTKAAKVRRMKLSAYR